jgi:isopentenyl-diphosphate Delta-isomerase
MTSIQQRKEDHIRINLENDVQASSNPWDSVRLRHNALPEFALADVDLGTRLLGRKLAAPIVITGMTGGAPRAQEINRNLAMAAAHHQVAMGVGSQRAAFRDESLAPTYGVIKEHDVPLRIANLGLPQLIEWGPEASIDHARRAVEMVDAHALAIHLNFLQESVMPEGDTDATGGIAALESLVKVFRVPILVKETGAGISGNVAKVLARAGVAAIDVGGWGGTSFSAVESVRAREVADEVHERIGKTFWDWGIPTPQAVAETRQAVGSKVEVVATGGLRNGLDAARALAVGADAAGYGSVMFKAAAKGPDEAVRELGLIIEELKTALFLTGCATLEQLWKGGVLS